MVLSSAVAAVGCGGKGKGRGGRKRPPRVFTVHVTPVSARVLPNDIVAKGTTSPLREMSLGTQVSGSITRLKLTLGQKVKKGEVLARMSTVGLYGDSQQAAAEIKRLKADIAQADQELKDTQKLRDQKLVARKDFDDARYKLLRLQAQQSQARARLAQVGERYRGGVITAPFAGVIAAQNVELGDYVSPGKVIGKLVDLSKVKVTVSVAEVDMVRITRKMPVVVTVPALGDRVWPAAIHALAPMADALTGAFPVEILVDNREQILKGGMAAKVVFKGSGIRGIFVPVEAVVKRGGKPVAYVVPPGKQIVELRVCTTGLTRDGLVLVRTGLRIGDRLVVSGNTRLRKGSKIRIAGGLSMGAMGPSTSAALAPGSGRRPGTSPPDSNPPTPMTAQRPASGRDRAPLK